MGLLAKHEGAPVLNQALLIYLRQQHGIALPDLEYLSDINDPAAVFSALRSATMGLPGIEVLENTLILGLFDFAGLALYNELDKEQENLLRFPCLPRILADRWLPARSPANPRHRPQHHQPPAN